jgi:photosystem II stability/assembly factor-like uncharacterized protein
MSYIQNVAFVPMHLIPASPLFILLLSSAFTASGQWTPVGPDGGSAHVLALDLHNPNHLLAGSRNLLLYRSENAGESWQALPFPTPYQAALNVVAIDPLDPRTFYAGVSATNSRPPADNGAGVYKSTDSGRNWTRIPSIAGISVYCLAIADQNPRLLVAGTNHGVYRSADSGQTWSAISPSANYELQGVMSIAIDPKNSRTIYAGTPHLPWKTTDGGVSWHSIHTGMIDDSDVFSIRIDRRNPERVYASACSGIYGSSSGGAQWAKLQGIPSTNRRTHVIAQDPKHASTLYAATTLGLWKSVSSGAAWRKTSMGDSINALVLDPAGVMYLAVDQRGLLKSTDGGETFREINHGYINRTITTMQTAGGESHPRLYVSTIYDGESGGLFRAEDASGKWDLLASEIALHGKNITSFTALAGSTRLVAASYDGFLRSGDDGHTWLEMASRKDADLPAKTLPKGKVSRPAPRPVPQTVAVPVSFPSPNVHIYALKASTGSRSYLVAATSAGLFYSANGDDWQLLRIVPKINLPVTAVFVASGNSGGLAAITPAGLYISHDRGQTWLSAFLPDRPDVISEVSFDATDPNLAVAATSFGIYQSQDGGKTWAYRRGGMPSGEVTSVVFHPSHHAEVYALHFGWVYRSLDGGRTWKAFDRSGLGDVIFRTIAFDLSQPAPHLYGLALLRGVFAYRVPAQSTTRTASASPHDPLN